MIRVTDKYVIDVDSMNYIPKIDKHTKKIDKKTNKEYDVYVTLGYYSTLCGALESIKEDMFKDSVETPEVSLYEALNTIRSINREFIETFNRVLEENK